MSKGVGLDMVEIKRFTPFKNRHQNRFLLNNYSSKELDYCFSFKGPAPHLAGTFAAKEAVFKALDKKKILFSKIEIIRNKNGKPSAKIENRLQKNLQLSISHTSKFAIAIAIF